MSNNCFVKNVRICLRCRLALVGLIFLLIVNVGCFAENNPIAVQTKSPRYCGRVDIIASICNAAGITLSSLKFPTNIEQIRRGSPAAYSGLRLGDIVLLAQIIDDELYLVIWRDGHRFALVLDTKRRREKAGFEKESQRNLNLQKLNSQTISLSKEEFKKLEAQRTDIQKRENDRVAQQKRELEKLNKDKNSLRSMTLEVADGQKDTLKKAEIDKTRLKAREAIDHVLINHDLVLIIDRSGSMKSGNGILGLSKWQWCSEQSANLAKAVTNVDSSISIIFFNDKYKVFEKVDASDIPTLFSQYRPVGDTRLALPLQETLNNYFQKRERPLVILVITDGMPSDPKSIALVLNNAKQQLKYSGEVTVIVMLIGEMNASQLNERFGQASTKTGGINILRVIPFDKLSELGFEKALADELSEICSTTIK